MNMSTYFTCTEYLIKIKYCLINALPISFFFYYKNTCAHKEITIILVLRLHYYICNNILPLIKIIYV